MRTMKKITNVGMVMVIVLVTIFTMNLKEEVFADEEIERYIFDAKLVNAGDFGAYCKTNKISTKDPHYNWNLGDFVMTGYTACTKDQNGDAVFLKTFEDEVTLSFDLQQDIDKLNGNGKLFIDNDKRGQDEILKTKKTNFKKGALLVRYTDPDNKTYDTEIYTDFLTGNSKGAENMSVVFNEEGVYEVALDYKVESSKIKAFGGSLGTHNRYRMSFKFTVQNGTNTGFVFDESDGKEIEDFSIAPEGFYIDLANSKYVDVEYKWEVLNSKGTGLITQESAVAKDGDEFTKEGIYTVTFKNDYVDEKVTRTICVGQDEALKEYITNGKVVVTSNSELNEKIVKSNMEKGEEVANKKLKLGMMATVVTILITVLIGISLKRENM